MFDLQRLFDVADVVQHQLARALVLGPIARLELVPQDGKGEQIIEAQMTAPSCPTNIGRRHADGRPTPPIAVVGAAWSARPSRISQGGGLLL